MDISTTTGFARRDKLESGPRGSVSTVGDIEKPNELAGDDILGEPGLLIEPCSPDRTVAALCDLLSKSGLLYDRGVPVRLGYDEQQHCTIAEPITPDGLVLLTHQICRPYQAKRAADGTLKVLKSRLPKSIATMYVDWRGNWKLPVLHGISPAPLLCDDGAISEVEGYDPASKMWIENLPGLGGLVPERPTREDALASLALLRRFFASFCFADAETIVGAPSEPARVDILRAPGLDESSFLAALMTAVCRMSLDSSPGFLMRAPPFSGAGTGKGLLARCICIIAFGRQPQAVTVSAHTEEVDKRIASVLMDASPTLFLDKLNSMKLKSDLLASVMTEKPSRMRLLGKSQMVTLNSSAFVIATGNGLSVSEDLARRFISIDLDAGIEDPELRHFDVDILAEVKKRRHELLAAALTIWRWGRQSSGLTAGRPLGNFERWSRWVRDPLVALGCADPIDRIIEAKQRDGFRRDVVDLFEVWWAYHADNPVTAANVGDPVRLILDPHGRGRQFVASRLEKLAGSRLAGFRFSRQQSAGKWGAATYKLERADGIEHREHRAKGASDPPMSPTPTAVDN